MSKTFLPENIYTYVRDHSVRESNLLRRLREETLKTPNPEMQITSEQGKFLSLLVQLIGAVNTIEIGVFTGYSSICVAQALPAKGKIIACDVNEEWSAVARRYWSKAGVAQKIDLRLEPAVNTLHHLIKDGKENFFDFVFIDADKENLDTYFELSLKLIRAKGVIAIDNTLRNGEVLNPSSHDQRVIVTRALNDKLINDDRVVVSLLPIADGLTLAMKC
jgi:predicted O-methyltransferase YrrM